jgi:methyltransferase
MRANAFPESQRLDDTRHMAAGGMNLAYAIMAFVTLQRLAELVIAARNTRALKARGAIEFGAAHYPAMVVLHGAWLIVLWATVGERPVNLPLLGVFAVLQALRIWVLATLGSRWTTRIIVLPGAPLSTGGPFRILRHPNYCVVIGEIAVLPLVFGLVWVSIVFSLLNAAMLWVRIGTENRALYHDPQSA